jgi:hypothetical protein
MALVLEARYSKKLGLPGYSSHEYAITVRTEVTDMNQAQAESSRLYASLQSSVDREIQQSGWLPEKAEKANGNGHSRVQPPRNGNGTGHNGNGEHWMCSPKQKDYILTLVDEHKLDKNNIEVLAQDRFGKPVKALNKLEASGLIEELLRQVQPNGRANGNGHRLQKAGAR